MENIKQMAENYQRLTEAKQELLPNTASALIDWFWHTMTEIYGEQWVRQFGDEPSSAWRQELGRLTERQLKAGVQRVIKERMEWPPNLIKFLDLCDNAEPPLDSYRRFMSGEKYLDYAERQTRNLIGWDCKNRLSADKAEKLWIETITRIRREQAEEEREVAQLAHSQSLQIGADNDSTR